MNRRQLLKSACCGFGGIGIISCQTEGLPWQQDIIKNKSWFLFSLYPAKFFCQGRMLRGAYLWCVFGGDDIYRLSFCSFQQPSIDKHIFVPL